MGGWREAKAPDGRTYYYVPGSRETTWEKPKDFDAPATPTTPGPNQSDPAAVDGSWRETSAADGRKYYFNSITRETTWVAPPAFLKHQQNTRSAAPSLVAGGGRDHGEDGYGGSDRRMERRDDRDHGLPQKPNMDGGRSGGMPWDQRQENTGFRGPMPAKTDEPEYSTYESAEEAFFKLLRRQNISSDTPWEKALRLVIREREYRALKDPKERKQAYEKYCVEVRAQEKSKEKERREKLREEFRRMLGTHDEIKHYTRWKTARPIIEREAVFKNAGDEAERRQMFDEYIVELKRKNADEEIETRRDAMQSLEGLLQALVVDPDTKWADAHESIMNNERFSLDVKFRALSNGDILQAFDNHMKALERVTNDAKQMEKRLYSRRERQARDNFKKLLSEMQAQGKINAGTKWKDLQTLVAKDERYVNLIGTPGSSPLDLFWDVLEEEERHLRSRRSLALDVLDDKRFEITIETSLAEFEDVMSSDTRTASFNGDELRLVYEKLMEKIKKRAQEDKAQQERSQRKAIDALRSVIKHLEPPVRLGEMYEDVEPRLHSYIEFQALDDDEARRSAFEKHMRRLKEKEEEHERDRARRDRDRDHRNGSRRDERDRRHRTRTPEVDAYEADRRKAQADRERQYRKASFGLTPPPRDRERRDDRDERYRRHDRHESGMSIYDRERREREMERERNYVSRADPRDKGRTLDYGDEDAVGSRPGSIRKRRDSDGSRGSSRRDNKVCLAACSEIMMKLTYSSKRARRARSRTPDPGAADPSGILKEDERAVRSGSEEGEIEEV